MNLFSLFSGELNLPQSNVPLNRKDEEFNYFTRTDRVVKEFKVYVSVAPEIPDGPEPYYQRVYQPLSDVLKKLYPKDFVLPPAHVAEGNTVPIKIPPYSADHDLDNRATCTWRVHPSYLPPKNTETKK